MKKSALFFLLSLVLSNLQAQDLTIEQTLKYIKDKFATLKPQFKFRDGFNHESCPISISIQENGKISIMEKNRQYKYNNDNGTHYEETTYYVSYAFYASEVEMNYNLSDRYPYYLLIICIESASQSNCIVQSSTYTGQDFDTPAFALEFGDKNVGTSIYNAMLHLTKQLKKDAKYINQSTNNDPFAPKLNSTYIEKTGQTDSAKIATTSTKNTVQMVKGSDGVYEVPVMLNDVLKINFIFDSGAADVSISSDVALTLIKTGTIKQSDFIGSQKYLFADGSSATSKVFILHEIKIGKKTLKNVRASISTSSDAPMLLGQTVMQQFGKFTIDNVSHTLTIE